MKSKFFKTRFFLPVLVVGLMALSSCKKVFDVEPQNILGREQTYRNVFDADAAILGVYGKFMLLAKQYVLLNELRADLMSPTANADLYLQQLSNHTVTPENPYIDPTPYYEVILNCNDVMKNFDIMLADKKLKVDEYNYRYSDIAAIRSFVYLQLGIHFGSVPYVTDPITNASDIHNESLFPKITFPQLLAQLIKTMEALPTLRDYPTGTTLITTVDQYTTNKFFINKNVILGDIYLWNGAYDPSSYRKAATQYRILISTYDNDGNINTQKNYYHLVGTFDPNTGQQLSVQYVRFREGDINALFESNTEGWRSMFSRGKSSYDQLFNWEWIWVLPFNNSFAPKNPFIDLFSNRGGSYLVKPSQVAMDNWNSQVQTNGFPFDARGNFTYKFVDGQPVIMKYLYYVMDGNSLLPTLNANGRTGDWWLYRAASVWQHFGEAANRDGYYKLGYAIVNQGIRVTYNGSSSDSSRGHTLFLPPPYNFAARTTDAPQLREPYRDMAGLRGRANLKSLTGISASDSLIQVESMLTDEAALEMAYEGQRWSDLLRVALRRNDPTYLAKKIGDKLRKDGLGAEAAKAEAKLSSIQGLYLPFIWK